MKIEVIPNFLSVERCNKLLHDVDPLKTALPMVYFGKPSDNGISKVTVQNIFTQDIINNIPKFYNEIQEVSLVYYPTGSKNTEHCDNSQIDIINGIKTVKRFRPWTHTGIIFLNNTFSGGELVYPDQGCVFLPTIGTMIIAPAGPDYPHFVNKITSGERFTLVFRFL